MTDWVGDLEENGIFAKFNKNRFVMSFAGSVFDMIQRSEANRAAVRSRREKAAYMRKMYIGDARRRGMLVEKPLAPEELAKIKEEIRQSIRRERRRTLWLTWTIGTAAAAITVGGLVFLLGRVGIF